MGSKRVETSEHDSSTGDLHKKKKHKSRDKISVTESDGHMFDSDPDGNTMSEKKRNKKKRQREENEIESRELVTSNEMGDNGGEVCKRVETSEHDSPPSDLHKKKKQKSRDSISVTESGGPMDELDTDGNAMREKIKKKKKHQREKSYVEEEFRGLVNSNESSDNSGELQRTRENLEEYNVESREDTRRRKNGQDSTNCSESETGNGGERNSKKKRAKSLKGESGASASTTKQDEPLQKESISLSELEIGNGSERNHKKKSAKSLKDDSQGNSGVSSSATKQDDPSHKSTASRGKRTVSFSENVEVFPSNGDDPIEQIHEGKLVQGKRFTIEEDEMIKGAVLSYVDSRELGDDGVDMVLRSGKYPEIRGCWKEIAAALPWRPVESIYYRAHILFERDDKHPWTEEELEIVRRFHEKHGADWRTLADALGKHRFHVKDTWRRIKYANLKKGHWSQDEYQKLFDLVNTDLRMKILEEKKSKHGMLRDNISWGAISDKLETRTFATCCDKWYDQLSSPMVRDGVWLDTDDYHLLLELYDLDACCIEDVDWDNLLEHRSGDLCRKRWNQMVKHIGEHRDKSFAEQVDILIDRYCPDVLEAREAYNKNIVED